LGEEEGIGRGGKEEKEQGKKDGREAAARCSVVKEYHEHQTKMKDE